MDGRLRWRFWTEKMSHELWFDARLQLFKRPLHGVNKYRKLQATVDEADLMDEERFREFALNLVDRMEIELRQHPSTLRIRRDTPRSDRRRLRNLWRYVDE